MQNFGRNPRKTNGLSLSDIAIDKNDQYTGRFAPSPTGPLHLGSLFTALASYLDARAHQGRWLLRIDDLDTPRNRPGSVEQILACLDTFGLHWDGEVYYQSRQLADYENFLAELGQKNLTYRCACSRKMLAEFEPSTRLTNMSGVYPGICRNKLIPETKPSAIRVKTNADLVNFCDEIQGLVAANIAEQHGDFILKRKDGIVAYQLAVVVDDSLQKVNKIVRGCDLLAETNKQIYLQQLLRLTTPNYSHVPVIVDNKGFKLSKQTLATAVDQSSPNKTMFYLLVLLRQNPPNELKDASVDELLHWAVNHWQVKPLVGQLKFQLT